MAKGFSYTISYILLLAVVLVSEVVLVISYSIFLASTTSTINKLTELGGGSPLKAVYVVDTAYVKVPLDPIGRRYIVEPVTRVNLYITNPGVKPVDFKVLVYNPALPGEKLVSLENYTQYINVSEIDVLGKGWFRVFPGRPGVVRFLSFYGVPARVFLCTSLGCTSVETGSGGGYGGGGGSRPWVVGGGGEVLGDWPIVSSRWKYTMSLIGGPLQWCGRVPPSGSGTVVSCGNAVVCCTECPSGCNSILETGRGVCRVVEDYMPGFQEAYPLPAYVVAGYYSSDPSFSFQTPGNISILAYQYPIHGLNMTGDLTRQLIPSVWVDYDEVQCFANKIVLEITLYPRNPYTGENTSFQKLYPNSNQIYVYVGARGYQTTLGINTPDEHDNITIKIGYERIGEENITWLKPLTANNNAYTDNQPDLVDTWKINKWAINTTAEYIKVEITYMMDGPRMTFFSLCFKGGFCGEVNPFITPQISLPRKVRLTFYIELIPEEYLSLYSTSP